MTFIGLSYKVKDKSERKGSERMLKKVQQPVLFQGNLDKSNYFEGWYYRQVSADQKTSLSFIPAVSLNKNDAHSFIQYILVQLDEAGEESVQTGYVRFPVSAFQATDTPFSVTIGSSVFSESGMRIDLEDELFRFKGEIGFGPLHPIRTSRLQPNIMGIFGYFPKLECYHGVISMKHDLYGQLEINGDVIDFTGGRGYLEKDWGTSFPKKYIWLQSNQFREPTASLFASVAHIPFHVTEIEGFVCNFVIHNREYRFATYTPSHYSIEKVTEDFVHIHLESKKASLEIQAEVLGKGQLIAPVKGTMEKAIEEGISGRISIRLHDKRTGETFMDTGENAGVEIVDYP